MNEIPDSLEILKMRVLLCFLSEDSHTCTVTGLSKVLGEGKQKVSRLLIAMEKEGLIDRSDVRRPYLTEKGRLNAVRYEERSNVILNHLLYEGLDMDNAEHDAYAWALFSSNQGIEMIRSSEQRYRAKYELRKQESFGGEELCRHLGDGEYRLPFLIYREHVKNGSNLSMANAGFEHPCSLVVKDGVGTIFLKPIDLSAKSRLTGKDMFGRVRKLMFLEEGRFNQAEESDEWLSFPADSLFFMNLGTGMGQILHGSVCLKMQCSVGTIHMPESTAIFTILV